MSNKKPEAEIEAYLVKEVEKAGGLALKWGVPGRRGYLDQLVFFPQGTLVIVEVKSGTGVLSALQEVRIKTLEDLGHAVLVICSRDEVDLFITFVKNHLAGSLEGLFDNIIDGIVSRAAK